MALHPIEAEQLTHALTELEEHRRLIAVLTHLVLQQSGLPPDGAVVLDAQAVAHLGACVTGAACVYADRQGTVRLTLGRGRY